ncbi:MAG: hypothetical protein AABY75_03975, partial [Bacteroidota bacterium]
MAAHAVVRKQEGKRKHRTLSAWSGDTRFREKRGHWATYTTIVIDCDRPASVTHRAFAFSVDNAFCFSDYGFAPEGWTNFIADQGTYTHFLYADATQCDGSNGTEVGKVTLVYDGSTATVTFETIAPYVLTKTAVYAGSTDLPLNGVGDPTVDPNEFPYIHGLSRSGREPGISGAVTRQVLI